MNPFLFEQMLHGTFCFLACCCSRPCWPAAQATGNCWLQHHRFAIVRVEICLPTGMTWVCSPGNLWMSWLRLWEQGLQPTSKENYACVGVSFLIGCMGGCGIQRALGCIACQTVLISQSHLCLPQLRDLQPNVSLSCKICRKEKEFLIFFFFPSCSWLGEVGLSL